MLFGEEKMKAKEVKRVIKIYFILFLNFPFWAYIKKNSTFTFGAWSFLLVHIQFTPSEGPKSFVN